MSSYVGQISNDPIEDLLLDILVDRGHPRETVESHYKAWQDSDKSYTWFGISEAVDSIAATIGLPPFPDSATIGDTLGAN